MRSPLVIRRATAADAQVCGKICFDAFGSIARQHNFPIDFPSPDVPIGVLSWMFSHPAFYCVVAEQEGKIIGSNCLDERTPIAGVGPVTVDPTAQNHSAGRQLMEAVMTRSAERNFAGIRLVQSGYHSRSLALYAKLGFVVREPLVCIQGTPINKTPVGYEVRPATAEDVAACNDLCMSVHGHDRGGELKDGILQGNAVVAESNGRLKSLRFRNRLLWSRGWRNESGPDRASLSVVAVFGSWHSCSFEECGAVSLVPREWAAGGSDDDLDDNGAIQRACRRLSLLGSLLAIGAGEISEILGLRNSPDVRPWRFVGQ